MSNYVDDIKQRQSLIKKVYKNSECEFCDCFLCKLKVKENKKTYKKHIYCKKCFDVMINS